MGGYLQDYGASEARREKVVRRIGIGLLAAAVLALLLYLQFRNYPEQKVLETFIENLKAKDYAAAYAQWGCTQQTPCRDYSYEKFQEDWAQADPNSLRILRSGHTGNAVRRLLLKLYPPDDCKGGIIRTVRFGNRDEVAVYVSRQSRTISYSPWPICDPRIPAGSLRGTQ